MPDTHNPNPIMRKQQTNPNEKDSQKIRKEERKEEEEKVLTCLHIKCQYHERQRKTEELFQINRD